jgi:subtilisin family serine protease
MITRKSAIAAAAAMAVLFATGASGASRQEAMAAKNAARSGNAARLDPLLSAMQRGASQRRPQADLRRAASRKLPALRVSDGYVSISAYGDDLANLRAQLVAKGLKDAKLHDTAVSGRAPLAALADMSATRGLKFLRPVAAMTRAGSVTTQGDRSLRANVARAQTGVDGRGIRVGVLSDSYDCAIGAFAPGQPFTRAAQDIARNDLPRDILLLKDLSDVPIEDCTDEGRAMMQIIHDVAPRASQAFYTAFESPEDFADGIRALAKAGARIIVDDVIYFEEPMFEDGIIAQAVDDVYKRGVAYFSAAGNDARASYESKFRASNVDGVFGKLHDFDAGRRVDALQSVTAGAGSITWLTLQWDQPSLSANGKRGAQSDVDVWFWGADGLPVDFCPDTVELPEDTVCQYPGIAFNVDADAIESAILVNTTGEDVDVQLGVELVEGPSPNYLKYVWFDLDAGLFSVNEYDTQSGTVYGHANAAGAEAVGAAAWYQTQEWGSPLRPQCKPACLDSFSSAGGVPILFGKNGKRLPFPEVRLKPGVTGPDGGNPSFFFFDLDFEIPGTAEPDGYPNFFGSSAAAPHVAAVAALMLDQRARDIAAHKRFIGPRNLSPDLVYWALRLTADDMKLRNFGGDIGPQRVDNANGFDFDTGFGFVDAQRALRATRGF